MIALLLAAAVAASPGPPTAPAVVDATEIPNDHLVRPGLATAGQPTQQGLTQLKALGFKTVINLRLPIEKWTGEEAAVVKAQGLTTMTAAFRRVAREQAAARK